jgi:hypothetical protein
MASRKVVTEFAAFGAPKNASVFGTAVQSTPFSLAGGTAAFGALRTNKPPGTMEDDDDDDDDAHDGPQRVELREDSITLDQASLDWSSLSSSQVLTRCCRQSASRCRAHGGTCAISCRTRTA